MERKRSCEIVILVKKHVVKNSSSKKVYAMEGSVSSITIGVIRTISSQFIIFYEQILSVKKALKHKLNNSPSPFWSFCARKKLWSLLFFVSLILFCSLVFAFDVFFCARNLFVKKINRLDIVLIASITMLLISSRMAASRVVASRMVASRMAAS